MTAPETTLHVPGIVVGKVDGVSPDGSPRVLWGTRPRSARKARVVWMPHVPDWEACAGLPVVLAFEDGDEERPIVVGLLAPPPVPDKTPEVIALESEEELVLQCGKAKIALRADGRVVIQGGYVISRSTGPNKLKGGSVQIN